MTKQSLTLLATLKVIRIALEQGKHQQIENLIGEMIAHLEQEQQMPRSVRGRSQYTQRALYYKEISDDRTP